MRFAPPDLRRWSRVALLWALTLSTGAAAQQPLVVRMPESGPARGLLFLGEELSGTELHVSLEGWHSDDGRLREELPEGVRVTFPPKVSPSSNPLVPVMVHATAPLAELSSLTLSLRVRGDGREFVRSLRVELPERAIFELQAPERVLAFPDRRTSVPVLVRNVGNTTGRAEWSFSGLAATAVPVSMPAGSTRTVHIELPPLTGGERTLTVTLAGGDMPRRTTIEVVAAGSSARDGYGLMTTIAAEARANMLPGMPATSEYSVASRGYLSRFTYLDLGLAGNGFDLPPKPRIFIRHRDTTLELAERSRSSPAGEVGHGFYLAHRFTDLPVIEAISVGVAFPLDGEEGLPRFGLMLDGSRFRTRAALTFSGEELTAEARADFAPFHASLRLTPSRDEQWRGSLQYAARNAGAQVEAWRVGGETRVAFGSRYALGLPVVGTAAVSARLDLSDWTFASFTARASVPGGRAGLLLSPDGAALDGEYAFSVGEAVFRLNANMPLFGAGTGRISVGTSLPLGPLLVDARTSWATSGVLEAELKGSYTAFLPRGSLAMELGLEGGDLLREARVRSRLGASYTDLRGFGASAGVEVPVLGPGAVALSIGGSYGFFVTTPDELALLLDGPDPTSRSVRVELAADGQRTPVAGVRLTGCGATVATGSSGSATLRGPPGRCEARVEAASLPAGTFLAQPTLTLEPGASALVTILATTQLEGVVRYRDVETGEVLDRGPQRDVRVMLEGPVSRWSTSSLPRGSFRFDRLPVGEYQAFVVGREERVSLSLTEEGGELLLTVPAPRRQVLEPSAVTPPLRVDVRGLLVERSEPIRLSVSSTAEIEGITVEGNGTRWEFDSPGSTADGWEIELRVPPGVPAGALNLDVAVRFGEGQEGRRTVQVIVIGEPDSAGEE